MIEVRDQARGRWRSILPMFGISPKYLVNKHGPCPICGGKDRFRFDDEDGRGTFFCNQCRGGDGFTLLIKTTAKSFKECAEMVRERIGEATISAPPKPKIDAEAARRACNDLWMRSVPLIDNDASQYLATRGLQGPYSNALRYCPSARVSDCPGRQTLPAMVAMVMGPDGKPVTLHRTYLDGPAKALIAAPRKLMAGGMPDGSAIRLGAHDGCLGIAEGIETALAVTRATGIVCWSAINATGVRKFAVPDDVRELHIFGDNDPKFGGQSAAFDLAYRVATGRQPIAAVTVSIPPNSGEDWAEVDAAVPTSAATQTTHQEEHRSHVSA